MSKSTVDLYMNVYRSNVKGGDFKGDQIYDSKDSADLWHKNFGGQERLACIPISIVIDTLDGEFIKFTEEL